MTTKYEIFIDISQFDGTDCSNPEVVLLDTLPSCVDQNCEFDKNSGKLTFYVDDDLCAGVEELCLTGFIRCPDCSPCGIIDFKRCIPIDGACPTGMVLVNGLCVDVCDEVAISQGKKSINGICQCPPEKPIFSEDYDRCVECIDGETHPDNKCLICRNGTYVQKDCDGTCDPTTGDCIPDCKPNAKWDPVDKRCKCVDGYVVDENGNCVEAPECTPGDPNIPPCKICVDGTLVDIICPDPNQICVDGDCVDKPCEGDCENGFDCPGTNCGCDKVTEKCVNCDDNPDALGCGDNPCSGGCSSGKDCGEGCGCLNGECVPCSYFSCPEDCGKIDGCGCNTAGDCEGVDEDCKDDLELKVDGCNLVAELTLQKRCQCEGISGGVNTTIATVTTSAGTSETLTAITHGFEVDIRKGIASTIGQHTNLELFSNAVINNELPENGTVVLEYTPVVKTYFFDENGNIASSVSEKPSITRSKTLENKSVVVFEGLDGFTGTYSMKEDGTGDKFIRFIVQVTIKDLSFASGCVYPNTLIHLSTESQLEKTGYIGIGKLLSTSSRNPLFTWKREGVVFRSFYNEKDGDNKYRDTLYGPKKLTAGQQTVANDGEQGDQLLFSPEGELLSLLDYEITVDCGCDTDDIKEDLVICDIEFEQDIHFRLERCNKKIVLDQLFDVCPINQNLEFFGWGVNHPSQTIYILKVNGSQVAQFKYDNALGTLKDVATGVAWGDWSKTYTTEITSASLEMNHSSSCKVTRNFSIELPTPKINLDCQNDGTVTATIYNTNNPGINFVSVEGIQQSFYMLGKTLTIPGLIKGQEQVFVITFQNGCSKEITKTDNCCEDKAEVTVQSSLPTVIGNNTVEVNYTVTGIASPRTVTLDGVIVSDTGSVDVTAGDHTIVVSDSTGCEKSVTFTITEVEDNSELSWSVNPICTGDNSTLQLTAAPNTSFTIVLPNGSESVGVTDGTGAGTVTGLTGAGIYTLKYLGGNTINKDITLSVIPVLDLTTMTLSSSNVYCSGTTIEVDLVATPNTVVTLSAPGATGDTTIEIDSNGNGTASLVYGAAGSYTITASSIAMNGQCSTALGDTLPVTISTNPSITDVQTECLNPAAETSDILITVTAQSGLTVTGVVEGTTYNFVATGVPSVYEATIPEGSGKSIAITASNSSCSDVVNPYVMEDCDCPVVQAPSVGSQSVYFTCDGGTVTLSVTPAVNTTVKWFSDSSLVNLLGTGSTYTTAVAGTYYAAAFNADDCPSSPVSLSVVDGTYTVSISDPGDICVNEPTVFTASIAGNNVGIEYLFRVNGTIVQTWGNSNTYTYTPSTTGTKTIEVSARRYGTCVKTDDVSVDVVACCDTTGWTLQTTGDTTLSCETVVAQASGGTAPYSYAWAGTGDDSTVIAQTGDTFDPSSLSPGELIDLTLTVTDSAGCSTTFLVTYDKCSCICDSNDNCQSVTNGVANANGYGEVYSEQIYAGSTYKITLLNNGAADRFRVNGGATLVVDTGYLSDKTIPWDVNGTYHGDFASYGVLPSSGMVTGDYATVTGYAGLYYYNGSSWVATADSADFKCAMYNSYPYQTIGTASFGGNVNALITSGAFGGGTVTGVNVLRIPAGVEFTYTPASDEVLQILHNDSGCNAQQTFSVTVECV